MPDKKKHPKRVYPNQYHGMLTNSIPELLEWYKDTLRDLQCVYESYTAEMNHYKVICTYPDITVGEQVLQRLEAERSLVSGMISNLQYCIEWMETARRPGNKRGIEKRSYEQRNVYKEAYWWSKFAQSKEGQKTLSDDELQKLDDLLGCLNKEQYEVFILIHGRCFTYGECARTLGMTKGNVQYHLERAEQLLREKAKGGQPIELQGTLF